MRRSGKYAHMITWAAIALGGCLTAQALPSGVTFDIAAGTASSSLKQFAMQAHLQLLFDYRAVQKLKTPAVKGQLSPPEALKQLLSGSGFTFREINDHTIAVLAPTASLSSSSATDAPVTAADTTTKEGKTSSSDAFRLAQASPGASAPTSPVAAASASTGVTSLEEVVVTAQKREESIQHVPVPVSVIDAQQLATVNQVRLADYYTSVPGLSMTPSDFGGPQIAIRGLTTGGFTNPTVGVTLDDVPYGSSSSLASGEEIPDLDPSDLKRIEVLRGPQGTLYGASSMGGLLKFVSIDPSTSAFTGRFEAGLNGVENGDEIGYNLRGAANVPISDSLAVRASGFSRLEPGYIDNVFTGQRDVNAARAQGGRLAMLWRANEAWTLRLSALIQHFSADGSDQIVAGLGDLEQNFVRGAGGSTHDIQAYSAVLNGEIGIGELTSVTGYSINKFSESIDYTSLLGSLTESGIPAIGFAGFGVKGTPLVSHADTSKFTQELRWAMPLGSHVDWLLGGFFDHESSPSSEDLLASDPLSGAVVGSWAHISDPSTFTEYAAFTDFTVHLTDAFDVQLGARESHNRQTYSESFVGPYTLVFLGRPSPVVVPEDETSDNAFTYLITPRLALTPEWMLYARFASGYRPGGPNISTGAFVPPHFAPDTTRNYELGLKGELWDHLLSVDASLYYIDWNNIQLQLINPTTGVEYFANGSRAKSDGVELSAQARPVSGLTVTGWVTWNDAVLKDALPATSTAVGAEGDRLPYSSRFSARLAIEETFALTGRLNALGGASVTYMGDRQGVFPSLFSGSTARQDLPSYTRVDLHAGVAWDSWTVNLFANNVTDKRGLLGGGIGTTIPSAFSIIPPRTYGLSLVKTFE